ncbi:MAG: amino acid adenylation domain-containing protein, partial [Gammaproteobacteria bacterium]
MSRSLLQQFEEWAISTPDAPAIRFEGIELSYRELNRKAGAIAAALKAERGEFVGLCAEPAPEFIAGMLGILKAGCAWVPLEPSYPVKRLRTISAATNLRLILAGAEQLKLSQSLVSKVTGLEQLSAQAQVIQTQVEPDDLAYVMFTSGSTDEPKGVMVSHANTAGLFSALQDKLNFSSADVWSTMHSPAFGFSVWEMWGSLSTGACLEIIPARLRNDPAAWLQSVIQQQVSILSVTPSGFRQLLAADCLPKCFDHLRLVIFSGEAVREEDIEHWFRLYPDVGAGPRLINTYALTETAGRICLLEYERGKPLVEGAIGQPVADAEVLLLDEAGEPVADGEEGQLYIAGPMLSSGYLNDQKLSMQLFPEFVTDSGQVRRYYKTGDRARMAASGELMFIGRSDHQVKLRGHRIE